MMPQVLIPFHRAECLSIAEAAEIAQRTRRTLRDWCNLHDLGRRVGGQWAVSRVALAMYLDGDNEALAAYLAGDRQSAFVVAYFERCNVPLSVRRDAA
jgi:cytochrome P450